MSHSFHRKSIALLFFCNDTNSDGERLLLGRSLNIFGNIYFHVHCKALNINFFAVLWGYWKFTKTTNWCKFSKPYEDQLLCLLWKMFYRSITSYPLIFKCWLLSDVQALKLGFGIWTSTIEFYLQGKKTINLITNHFGPNQLINFRSYIFSFWS